MADVKKLAEELVNLKVTEVNELATILKEEYGIEPAAAAVAVAAPAAGAGEAAAAEKSTFDVILKMCIRDRYRFYVYICRRKANNDLNVRKL